MKKVVNLIGGDKLVLIFAIIAVIAVFTAINPNYFSYQNLNNILVASALVGLVAIGETYLIIAGQVDLSPGSIAGFSGVLSALLVFMHVPMVLAIIITIALGGMIGYCNSVMVNKLALEAFIATLVAQSAIRGFAYIICSGKPVAINDPNFIALGSKQILGINVSVWIMLLCFAVFGFILARTKFGRSVYVVGGNKDAARLAGLNPQKTIAIAFILMGVLAALGGMLFAARMNTGQPSANVNLEFDAITAVILGGVSFTGGVGKMTGTVLGLILIQAFNTGLIMINVPSFWQFVAKAALLLFALSFDYIRKRGTNRQFFKSFFFSK